MWMAQGSFALSEKLYLLRAFFSTKMPNMSSLHLETKTQHRKLLVFWKYARVATLPSRTPRLTLCQVVITWLHACINSSGSGAGFHGQPLLSPKVAECRVSWIRIWRQYSSGKGCLCQRWSPHLQCPQEEEKNEQMNEL